MRPNGTKSEDTKESSREQSKKHKRAQLNVLDDYMHEASGDDILAENMSLERRDMFIFG